jgi:peptidoglycan lytic transglycosylase G
MTDDPFDDAFAEDPVAAEREQRRREREARRAKREAKQSGAGGETALAVSPEPAAAKSPKPPKAPKVKKPRRPRAPHRRLGLTVALAAILLGFAMIAAFAYRHFNRETPPPVVVRTITLTIPEGYTRAQTAELVREEGLRGDYEQASVSSRYLDPAKYGGKGAKSLEGFLFPDTFELEKRANVSSLVQLQLEDFRRRIKGVDMSYARSKNLTTYDVITVASLVEEEAQLESERPLVAAVIYNRLREGMPLGIDATVRFATGNYTQPLTESELAVDSPYNTRLNAGLPPGPIGSPGLASIEAAARPARVDYLFYVVEPGSCGEHAFSSSEAEFQRDVESYNSARAAAGGNSPDTCGE